MVVRRKRRHHLTSRVVTSLAEEDPPPPPPPLPSQATMELMRDRVWCGCLCGGGLEYGNVVRNGGVRKEWWRGGRRRHRLIHEGCYFVLGRGFTATTTTTTTTDDDEINPPSNQYHALIDDCTAEWMNKGDSRCIGWDRTIVVVNSSL